MCEEEFRDSWVVGGSGWGIDDGGIMGALAMKEPPLSWVKRSGNMGDHVTGPRDVESRRDKIGVTGLSSSKGVRGRMGRNEYLVK
jgi:hypothetical protein